MSGSVVGKHLPLEPGATVEQISMRALRREMRLQYAMHLALHSRAMPHDLVAPCDEAAKPLSPLIGT